MKRGRLNLDGLYQSYYVDMEVFIDYPTGFKLKLFRFVMWLGFYGIASTFVSFPFTRTRSWLQRLRSSSSYTLVVTDSPKGKLARSVFEKSNVFHPTQLYLDEYRALYETVRPPLICREHKFADRIAWHGFSTTP